jgi:predicted nuclease of predicted toxin-antitoxin system
MNFLIDAQLPIDLSEFLNTKGHNSIHTSQLPEKNFTSDNFIRYLSITDKRVVITKDFDFYDSYILKREPYKVVLVRMGNLKTSSLISIFLNKFDQIISCLEQGGLIELTLDKVKILY